MKRLFYLRPPFFKTKDMDYKEKYEQGLECIQEILSDAGDTIRTSILQKRLQPFFSELKESEDERIRKGIIRNLEYLADKAEGFVKDELKERIAWLEKQGEKKNTREREIDDAYLQGVCDAKHEIEKQGKKLDADKVKEHVPIMLEYMQNYVENIRKLIKGE